MDFKTGIMVSLKHYSDANLYRALIIEANYEKISVKIDDNINFDKFQTGDPLALGFEYDQLVYISSCNIMHIDSVQKVMTLKSDTLETLSNKRLFERFPVSFESAVKIGASKTENYVIIKNISFNGMLACSKTDYPLYQEMKMEFNIGSPVALKAVIIRKTKEAFHNEYGLKLIYTDPHTPALIKKYLQQLKKEQETYVNTLRNEPVPT